MAAEAGVKEAIQWLESGVEPTPPQFVPHPPFSRPDNFVRLSVDDIPGGERAKRGKSEQSQVNWELWDECQAFIFAFRARGYQPLARGVSAIRDVPAAKIGEYRDLKILLVDGNYVMVQYSMEYHQGGNGLGWEKDFIPKDEVWLDNTCIPSTWRFDLLHELHEIHLMLDQGLKYEDPPGWSAHDHANDVERVLRKRFMGAMLSAEPPDPKYLYHGPQAPGPGWVQVGVGPKGGKIWKFQTDMGKQQAPQQTQLPPGVRPMTPIEPNPAIKPLTPTGSNPSIRPLTTPQVAKPPRLDVFNSQTFAGTLREAGKSLPSPFDQPYVANAPGGHKVFVADLYDALRDRLPPGETIQQFKNRLMEMHNARHIEMSRLDLPEYVKRLDRIAESSTKHPSGTGEFHLVRVS